MTTPTTPQQKDNGADAEREAFEKARNAGAFKLDDYVPTWYASNLRLEGWMARAAAPVGTNAAADEARIALLTQVDNLCSQIESSLYAFRGDEEAIQQAQGAISHAKKVAGLYRKRAAGAPAETAKARANEHLTLRGTMSESAPLVQAHRQAETVKAVELIGVAYQIKQGAGFWHSCSGCHDTEDGHPVGNYAYSNEMQCALGNGCSECGGLGACWDNNDYSEAAGDFLDATTAPATAPDVAKDAARAQQAIADIRRFVDGSSDDKLALLVDDDIDTLTTYLAAMGALPPAGSEKA